MTAEMDALVCCWRVCIFLLLTLQDPRHSIPGVLAQTETLYLNSHAHCTSDVYQVAQAQTYSVVDKPTSPVKTMACRRCELLFKADAEDGHVCIETALLKVNDCNTTLHFIDSSDRDVHHGYSVTFNCESPLSLPQEWCSTSRYAGIQLEPLGTCHADRRNVEASFFVRHISNQYRVAYLDAGCDQTLGLYESKVEVRNRRPGKSNTLPPNCEVSAEYLGLEQDRVVCLKLTVSTCKYHFTLKIYDGMSDETTLSETYKCDDSQPFRWCSSSPSLTLGIERSGVVTGEMEPLNLFSVEVKDEKQTEVMKILSTESRLSSMRLVLIVAVVCSCIIVAVIIVAVLAFILIRRQQRRLREGASPVSTDPDIDAHQL